MALPILLGVFATYVVFNLPQISRRLQHVSRIFAQQSSHNYTNTAVSTIHSGFLSSMTEKEARRILGLQHQNPTVLDIKKAHRELISRNHLDTGGSGYITYKVNEARDLLLKQHNR
ncbi:hypothetical protein XU18_0861 [Perkinsela sp. CCAP 1560/4]|nr:hypothetical protein XU18_0861 [Perkinsela sp. CCAP 1560/4]|eukprot:KNH08664.1 hypothetical protein XU18_0861 [Perkinsela sp. CCAP 1560/4]